MSANKLLSVTSIYDGALKELMDTKRIRSDLRSTDKKLIARDLELKQLVADYVRMNGTVEFKNGRIEFKETVKRTFKRANTLDYIRQKYGDEVADDVDSQTTIINERKGIWVYLNSQKQDVENDDVESINWNRFSGKNDSSEVEIHDEKY